MRFSFNLLLFFFLFSLFSPAIAQVIQVGDKAIPVGSSTYFLPDDSSSLNLNDLVESENQLRFQKAENDILTFPLSDKPIWLKLEFEETSQEPLYLILDNYLLDSIHTYFLNDNKEWENNIRGQKTWEGNNNPFFLNYAIPLPKNKSGKQTIYIRIKALSGLLIPILVANERGLDDYVARNALFIGIVAGIFFILISLGFIAWYKLRYPALLYFIFELVATFYGFLMIKGFGNLLIWKGYMPLASQYFPFAMLMMLSFNLLCMSFLETKKRFPKLHKGFLFLIGLDLILVFSHFPTTLPSAIISFNLGIIGPLYGLGVAIYAWKKGVSGAGHYALGWAGYVVMVSCFLLTAFQIVPGNFFTMNAPVFGVFIEALFFILAMADRVSVLVKEQENAGQEKILKNMQISNLQSKADLLEKEKTIVLYESLKQQLNPHFLFNSLTSLGSLIRINPKTAVEFLEGMSKSYRYILKSQEHETVSLSEEIKFSETYVMLQKVRFEEGLEIKFDIPEEFLPTQIVPVTIQNLIENAIKHNIIDVETPLVVEIFVSNNFLVVRNNLQKKGFVETSNKQGLANLKKLYSYLDSRPVEVVESEFFYEIRVPLI